MKYEGIKEIRDLCHIEQVNRALEIDWVLLDIVQEYRGEGGVFSKELKTVTSFIVGRTEKSIEDIENWIEKGTYNYKEFQRNKPVRKEK